MDGKGFLGTNATVLADLSLILGILVALTLTVGMLMARKKRFDLHRWIQTSAVTLNILQVLSIMIASFLKSATPGIPERLGESYYAIALVHALLGTATMLFGTYVMLRGNRLVPKRLRFPGRHYKRYMRTAYGLYMLTTLIGIGVYLVWYTGAPAPLAQDGQPAAGELTVPMVNFEYAPRELVVPVGSVLVWVNQDSAPHTATSDDGTLFKSELLSTSQRFSQRLENVGEIRYFCELHGAAGGIGMSGTIKVVPADQAPAVGLVVAPTIAAPTPAPTSHALPTTYFGDPAGTAAFRDDRARSDQIVISLKASEPPPDGSALTAFLMTLDGGQVQLLGQLERAADGVASLSYSTPDRSNLAARFSRLLISYEPLGAPPAQPGGTHVYEGRLPAQAFEQIKQLLASGQGLPAAQGYIAGLRLQNDVLMRHAGYIVESEAAGKLEGVRRHGEHVYLLLAGTQDSRFTDLNDDGSIQNPGDGFGLLQNGTQRGYIHATIDAANGAANAADATDAIRLHAGHVRISAENLLVWASEARDLAFALSQATDPAVAKEQAARLTTLAQWIAQGTDANGDGQVAPVPGEGGSIVAYEHAQFIAGFGLFPLQ